MFFDPSEVTTSRRDFVRGSINEGPPHGDHIKSPAALGIGPDGEVIAATVGGAKVAGLCKSEEDLANAISAENLSEHIWGE